MIAFTNRFVLLFLAVAAAVPLAYLWPPVMFGAAVCVSALVCLALLDYAGTKPRFVVTRVFDERAGLGARVAVELRFVNTGGRPLHIEAEDSPPEHAEHAAGRFVLKLPPGAEAAHAYEIRPTRRGDLAFGPLFLRVRGPAGMIKKRFILEPKQDILRVFPNIEELKKYELLIQKGYFFMAGVLPLRYRGQGTTFDRLRDYLPDDNYQHINWKATARMSRPIIEDYREEKNQNLILVIDTGRLMGLEIRGCTKLDHVLRTALVLAAVGTLRGDNVALLAFSRDVVRYLPPAHGRPHLARCMDAIYNIQPTEFESDYARAFEFLFAKKLRRSLIVTFSDLIDLHASETLIKYLSMLSPRHLPLCVTMNDSDITDAAEAWPAHVGDLYTKTAAMALLEKREAVFRNLARRGVSIIDTRPEQLSHEVIRKYLELKARLLV